MNPKIKRQLDIMANNRRKYPENRDYNADAATADLIITTLSDIIEYYEQHPEIAKDYASARMKQLTSML